MQRHQARRVELIGAPVDLGSGGKGAVHGPAGLRRAGIHEAFRSQNYTVADRGDVPGLVNRPGATIDGCHHLREVAESCRRVRDALARSFAAGAVPVLMGGDHSLAIGSLAAVARHCSAVGRELFVLWFDAHADFNTPDSSPTGHIYGMPVAVAAGEGHPELTALGHALPMLDLGNVVQIGVRSVDPLEAVRIRERRLRVHTMDEVRARGMRAVVADALGAARRRRAHLHVSFDTDFLDPAVAPGTGLHEPGGPSLAEAEAAMDEVAASGLLGSFDLVELSPGHDPGGQTARRLIGLLTRAFAGAAGARPGKVSAFG